MPKTVDFQPLAMALSGPLDTRSRPADLLPGHFRFKLNMAVSEVGKMSRRSGFGALTFGQRSDDPDGVNNWDFHRQDGARSPVTMLHDSTGPDGTHRLFAATKTGIYLLDNDISEWTKIAVLTGGRSRAATLRDKVVFTNNVDDILEHTLGTTTTAPITTLQDLDVEKAKIVLEYQGVIILMNTVEDGEHFGGRVRWSNKNVVDFDPGASDPVTGFQDLPQGSGEILNAIIFNGQIWIFTNSGIYRMFVQVTTDSIFGFAIVYENPQERTGCLAYENTLCTDGKAIYWFGRDSVYMIDQYHAAPSAEEWLLKASGRVFTGTQRIDTRCCQSAVAWYNSDTKELYFSYARGSATMDEDGNCLNDYTLVLVKNDELAVPVRTADYNDHGYSVFGSFARNVESGEACTPATTFISGSAEDFCLKSMGSVFYRELITGTGDEVEDDIADNAMTITQRGYSSRIVGMIPAGYPQIEKVIRSVILEHDTVEQAEPNEIFLRIGNSFKLADPMDERANCSVLWQDIEFLELSCPDPTTIAAMKAKNQRPYDVTEWRPYYQGNYLYFDITVTTPDGGNTPVGSDSAWNSLTFDLMPVV